MATFVGADRQGGLQVRCLFFTKCGKVLALLSCMEAPAWSFRVLAEMCAASAPCLVAIPDVSFAFCEVVHLASRFCSEKGPLSRPQVCVSRLFCVTLGLLRRSSFLFPWSSSRISRSSRLSVDLFGSDPDTTPPVSTTPLIAEDSDDRGNAEPAGREAVAGKSSAPARWAWRPCSKTVSEMARMLRWMVRSRAESREPDLGTRRARRSQSCLCRC